ncbi:uncharacterized protein [Antedon mediterranea]|uniref:uncharacterized protein n=1 Tax=Antedon mediterranea TaxID=105859 RepID=UPI003AF6F579
MAPSKFTLCVIFGLLLPVLIKCQSCTNGFTCQDGECISDYRRRCDGAGDCSDSSDEVNCTTCNADEFQCTSGSMLCLPGSFECDSQYIDCSDGSDESMCLGLQPWNLTSIISDGETNDILMVLDGVPGAIYGGRLNSNETDLQIYYYNSTYAFTGIDYDPVLQEIYITDVENGLILKTPLSGSSFTIVVNENITYPEAVAVDHLTRTIFWTDSINDTIESVQIDGSDRKIIINTGLQKPRGIVALISNRTLFWSDWQTSKIERSSYEGQDRTTIAMDVDGWFNGLSLDVEGGWLYVAISTSTGLGSMIRRMDYWGNLNQLVHEIAQGRPFDVFYHQGFVYYTDWDEHEVVRVEAVEGANTTTPVTANVFEGSISEPTGLIIISYRACPPDWTAYNGSCYRYFSDDNANWQTARSACQNVGADLVVISSQAENDFVGSLISAKAWIGFRDIDEEGLFVWVETGECTNYTSKTFTILYSVKVNKYIRTTWLM